MTVSARVHTASARWRGIGARRALPACRARAGDVTRPTSTPRSCDDSSTLRLTATFGELPLAGERELGDLGLRQRDDEFTAGGTVHRVLEAVVLAQPSQKGQ